MINTLVRSQIGGRFLSFRFGLFTLFLALCIFSFVQVGYFVSSPSDNPVKSDLIVALGGDTGSRVMKAHELYANGFASRVLLTGMEKSVDQTQHGYLNGRVAFLVEGGVSKNAILYDALSRNTWEEAINTRHMMETNGWHSILVVSDPPHMRRLSWVWHKVFYGKGITYRLIAASMPKWDPEHWWRQKVSSYFVLKELIKLGYYHVAYCWWPSMRGAG